MVNATVVADPKHIADGHNYVLEMSLQLCEETTSGEERTGPLS